MIKTKITDHIQLAFNRSSSGNTDSAEWLGGEGTFNVFGSIGSATVALEYSFNKIDWNRVDNEEDTYVTLSKTGGGVFILPACYIRANISGTPVSITIQVGKI